MCLISLRVELISIIVMTMHQMTNVCKVVNSNKPKEELSADSAALQKHLVSFSSSSWFGSLSSFSIILIQY